MPIGAVSLHRNHPTAANVQKALKNFRKLKGLEAKVTRLRRMRTGTEPIVVGTNFKMKVPHTLENSPGAIKINVLHKIYVQTLSMFLSIQ